MKKFLLTFFICFFNFFKIVAGMTGSCHFPVFSTTADIIIEPFTFTANPVMPFVFSRIKTNQNDSHYD